MRKQIKASGLGKSTEFEFRGIEQTRIETFSDAVFALAVTLLVLSSTVPTTFEELAKSFHNIIPFGICITLLMLIWYQHYIFFIRYGFRDVKIVALNSFLLFLVLVYTYPLKFLFTVLYKLMVAGITNSNDMYRDLFTRIILPDQTSSLMVIYGLGCAAVFITLAIMYQIAYNRRNSLGLNKLECFHTKTNVYDNYLMAIVPLLSVLVASLNFDQAFMWSGLTYWLYAILMPGFHILRKRKKAKIFGKSSK